MSQMKKITFANDQTGESWTYDVVGSGGGDGGSYDLVVETNYSPFYSDFSESNITVDKDQLIAAVEKAISGDIPNVVLKGAIYIDSGYPYYTSFMATNVYGQRYDYDNGDAQYKLHLIFNTADTYSNEYLGSIFLVLEYTKYTNGEGDLYTYVSIKENKDRYDFQIETYANPTYLEPSDLNYSNWDIRRTVEKVWSGEKPNVLFKIHTNFGSGTPYYIFMEPNAVYGQVDEYSSYTRYYLKTTFVLPDHYVDEYNTQQHVINLAFVHEAYNDNSNQFYAYTTNSVTDPPYDMHITMYGQDPCLSMGNYDTSTLDIRHWDVSNAVEKAINGEKPRILLTGNVLIDSGLPYQSYLEPTDIRAKKFTGDPEYILYDLILTFSQSNYVGGTLVYCIRTKLEINTSDNSVRTFEKTLTKMN